MRDASRRRTGVVPALALFFSLCLGACGGGGGGGGGGGPNTPPTANLITPVLGVSGLLGDTFDVSFSASDDDDATVRIVADADRNLGTTGDQTVLFVGGDGNGVRQDVTLALQAPLAPGDYTVFLEVDDSVNPPLVIELPQPLIIYPALAGVAPPRSNRYGIVDQVVVFSRGEAEDGTGALNGDGLADDGVMVVYDAATGTLTQPSPSVSMDVTGVAGGRVRPLIGQAGVLTWLTLEVDENRNLNAANAQNPVPPFGGADADLFDAMVSYVVPLVSTTPVTNTYGGAKAILGMARDLILVQYGEGGEGGGGTMLNGDGDAADSFFGYVDPNVVGGPFEWNQVVMHNLFPGPALGLGFRAADVANAAWLATEAGAPALFDVNGDLDQGDTFLALGTLQVPGGTGAPAIFNVPAGFQVAPAQPPSAVDATGGFDVTRDGHAGYYIDELSNNLAPGFAAGNDRNFDGLIGMVPAFYNATTQTETIPGGAAGPLNSAPGSPLVYDTTRMFFTGVEAPRIDPAPGTNGDGDGGGDLQLLYWTDHAVPGAPATPLLVSNLAPGVTLTGLALDLGGSMTRLAPGWLAVIVNELANGSQDINASGNVDFAYLLIDTSTGPAPIVHNPRLVPSAAGTFPLAGVAGEDPARADQGVVVRVTELANGDLDGDGNGTETFCAYISFGAPTTPLLLDAGGDHCAVEFGQIGITADEAFTGQDYDGNGALTDVVFRVLDFTGAVLEPGLPCSRRSVPVTETGRLWAFLRDEAVEGRNLNGDGDTTDLILGLWIP